MVDLGVGEDDPGKRRDAKLVGGLGRELGELLAQVG